VLAPTLAVVLSWAVAGFLLLGCGFACRRTLGRALGLDNEAQWRAPDLWIGFAAVLAYLEVWSLLAPITWKALIAPTVVGLPADVVCLRRARPRLSRATVVRRHTFAAVVASGAGLLWLANLALGRPTNWDSGLYHFQAIEYATRFAAIPGLGNLQERLGAGDAHLLIVALLGSGPWHDAGFHLANGLLVAMLLAHVTWSLADQATPIFTRRVSWLLVPATLIIVALEPGSRLSSPSLDLPGFVLVAAGTLCLCEQVERPDPATAIGATAAYAAAAATRPQFFPAMILVAATVVLLSQRRARTMALVGVIPLVVSMAWAARQAVLSGYPLLPLKILALPVNWRVHPDVVDTVNTWIRSWARSPGKPPSAVLSSWDWFPPWLRQRTSDASVMGPVALALFGVLQQRSPQARRLLMATLPPLLLTLVIWFFAAPAPRFVWGPLWLVPIALLARGPLDKIVALLCVGLVATAVVIGGSWRPITTHGNGPLGSFNPPVPNVRTIRDISGLMATRPVHNDQCWRVLLCAPGVSPQLRLRGDDLASGFQVP
jgi:hypothetical protein